MVSSQGTKPRVHYHSTSNLSEAMGCGSSRFLSLCRPASTVHPSDALHSETPLHSLTPIVAAAAAAGDVQPTPDTTTPTRQHHPRITLAVVEETGATATGPIANDVALAKGRSLLVPVADSKAPTASRELVGSMDPPPSPISPIGDVERVTVFPNPNEPDSALPQDDREFMRLRRECPRFRILVIGKANAGKTTILQKMCNTVEKPIIRGREGRVIDSSIVEPTDGRGIHDIDNELTFSSNPAFVFHDSPGFEAASINEMENVHAFIAKRSASNELRDQLHTIWYCLPTDNDRPLCEAEMKFFEEGTGRTPVIAIFTKYDGMILKEYNRLRYDENFPRKEAKAKAPTSADELFKESEYYIKRLLGAPYPPARSLRVQDMHKPGNDCAELSRQTLEALDNKRLRQLFISVQQNNIGLSTEYGIKEVVCKALTNAIAGSSLRVVKQQMVRKLFTCYGHLFLVTDYGRQFGHQHLLGIFGNIGTSIGHGLGVVQTGLNRARAWIDKGDNQTERDFSDLLFTEQIVGMLEAYELALLSWAGDEPGIVQVLLIGIATLILCEDSFWLKTGRMSATPALKSALDNYQASSRHSGVMAEVKERLSEAVIPDLVTNQKDVLVGIVMEIVARFRAVI